jgi:hypothetical protein
LAVTSSVALTTQEKVVTSDEAVSELQRLRKALIDAEYSLIQGADPKFLIALDIAIAAVSGPAHSASESHD